MPSRITDERLQRNVEAFRALVDSGSPDIVRDTVAGSQLSRGRRKFPLPSIGTRSGHLTVTGYIRSQRNGVKAIVVKCACGIPEYTVDRHNLKNFKSTRCNDCAKKASNAKRYWIYIDAMENDVHRVRLLNRLSAAITRCHNPDNRVFAHYGGRGIFVHQEWRDDRAAFLKYVQTLPGWDDPAREMDREDNDKGYEPGNIRFATRSENALNKRRVGVMQGSLADLRSRLRRAEEQIHSCDRCRASYRP